MSSSSRSPAIDYVSLASVHVAAETFTVPFTVKDLRYVRTGNNNNNAKSLRSTGTVEHIIHHLKPVIWIYLLRVHSHHATLTKSNVSVLCKESGFYLLSRIDFFY